MCDIDVIGMITPNASKGHPFILVAINYFIRWVDAVSDAIMTKATVTRFSRVILFAITVTLVHCN